jgi:hypothetical protein
MGLNALITQFSGEYNLATKRRLKLFLRSIANLHVDNAAIGALRQKFPEFLPDFPMDSELAQLMLRQAPLPAAHEKLYSPQQTAAFNQFRLVGSLRTAIRWAWAAPNAETRDWKMFLLRRTVLSFYYAAEDKWPADPPPLTPLNQALRYLQMEGHRAQVCGNSECSAPLFWAMRRNQKFCSTDCATPARLAAQRRWWNEKGSKKPRKRRRMKAASKERR